MPSAGRHLLLPHPDSGGGAFEGVVEELAVEVSWAPEGRLGLRFRLVADLHALKLPEKRPPMRTDGLWRHSCFEAFVAQAGASDYREYNFSPSCAWAAYQFKGYREGMSPLMKDPPPSLRLDTTEDHLTLEVALDLSGLSRGGLRLGLAAVIEDRTQMLSYWALAHPAPKPDFHHADSFVLELA